jgi:tetratricopeptide (TPR) repeat protein
MLQAHGSVTNIAARAVAEFNSAYGSWSSDRFQTAAELFEQAGRSAPGDGVYHYWAGAAQFHRMLTLQRSPATNKRSDQADQAMTAAIEALSQAIKHDPKHAESHALLGTLYGMRIGGNVFRAAKYGPRVQKHMRQALDLGPGNPRVYYLVGTSRLHTADKPAERKQALEYLLKAEKLFEKESERPPEPLEPRWGYGSCLTFIGRAYEALGERHTANKYFDKAAEKHPARSGLEQTTTHH